VAAARRGTDVHTHTHTHTRARKSQLALVLVLRSHALHRKRRQACSRAVGCAGRGHAACVGCMCAGPTATRGDTTATTTGTSKPGARPLAPAPTWRLLSRRASMSCAAECAAAKPCGKSGARCTMVSVVVQLVCLSPGARCTMCCATYRSPSGLRHRALCNVQQAEHTRMSHMSTGCCGRTGGMWSRSSQAQPVGVGRAGPTAGPTTTNSAPTAWTRTPARTPSTVDSGHSGPAHGLRQRSNRTRSWHSNRACSYGALSLSA
jgi:hypothetical protein